MTGFDLDRWLRKQRLPAAFRDTADRAVVPLARWIGAERDRRGGARPLVVGLCGSHGSGKSTIADLLVRLLEADGLRVAVLSLDDLYLTHEARARLARERHPLLARIMRWWGRGDCRCPVPTGGGR